MNELELYDLVNFELNWLRYYALPKSRRELTVESEVYESLTSIGYTKRVVTLSTRCAGAMIFANNFESLKDLSITNGLRNHTENRYTPLEIFWKMYPERRQEVIDNLNSDQSKVKKIE